MDYIDIKYTSHYNILLRKEEEYMANPIQDLSEMDTAGKAVDYFIKMTNMTLDELDALKRDIQEILGVKGEDSGLSLGGLIDQEGEKVRRDKYYQIYEKFFDLAKKYYNIPDKAKKSYGSFIPQCNLQYAIVSLLIYNYKESQPIRNDYYAAQENLMNYSESWQEALDKFIERVIRKIIESSLSYGIDKNEVISHIDVKLEFINRVDYKFKCWQRTPNDKYDRNIPIDGDFWISHIFTDYIGLMDEFLKNKGLGYVTYNEDTKTSVIHIKTTVEQLLSFWLHNTDGYKSENYQSLFDLYGKYSENKYPEEYLSYYKQYFSSIIAQRELYNFIRAHIQLSEIVRNARLVEEYKNIGSIFVDEKKVCYLSIDDIIRSISSDRERIIIDTKTNQRDFAAKIMPIIYNELVELIRIFPGISVEYSESDPPLIKISVSKGVTYGRLVEYGAELEGLTKLVEFRAAWSAHNKQRDYLAFNNCIFDAIKELKVFKSFKTQFGYNDDFKTLIEMYNNICANPWFSSRQTLNVQFPSGADCEKHDFIKYVITFAETVRNYDDALKFSDDGNTIIFSTDLLRLLRVFLQEYGNIIDWQQQCIQSQSEANEFKANEKKGIKTKNFIPYPTKSPANDN